MVLQEKIKTIQDLVSQSGELHAKDVFLRWEEEGIISDVTYEEFSNECETFAAWLREMNEKAGHRVHVGLVGKATHQYIVALMATMSNGNIAVPLDASMEAKTLIDSVDRADVDIVIYDVAYAEVVNASKDSCKKVIQYVSFESIEDELCVDDILSEFQDSKGYDEVAEEDCAMILYTSGTTGKGKGVMLSHGNLVDNIFSSVPITDVLSERVYLNVLPIHHIFCINSDVLSPISYGAVLCLNLDIKKLGEHLRILEPTTICLVPMIATSLLNKIEMIAHQNPDKDIMDIKQSVLGSRLQRIVCGGAALEKDTMIKYDKLGVSLVKGYGMSECSPRISTGVAGRLDKVDSVGKLVDRCDIRFVEGEIQVKSPSVMMGYYKDPELTRETITEDGWLCTGDIGYMDDEGFLYITGRKKNLIILSNGENVAPEQIESMFDSHRLVSEIIVFEEDDTICAEIYPDYEYAKMKNIEDIEGTIAEIVKNNNKQLPTYKQILRSRLRNTPFPRTAAKKIIRPKNLITSKKKAKIEGEVRRPENELQTTIYNCLSGAMGHTNFGIDTDIYKAGIDSLGCTMALADICNKLNVSITIDDLLDNPTVLLLEKFINTQSETSKIDYSKRPGYPLSGVQMYFAYIMRGNTTANIPTLVKLGDNVDLDRLKSAIEGIFEIHPELKGIIQPTEQGHFALLRNDEREIDIPIYDTTEAEWAKIQKTLLKPYMYTEGEPLYHIGLYKTEAAKYMFFDIAHVMSDGASIGILIQDINDLYEGKEIQKQDYTFYEYIVDEYVRKENNEVERDRAYFCDIFDGFRLDRSILNRPDYHDLEQGEDGLISRAFTKFSREDIRGLCKKYNTTENSIFFSAFNYLVSLYSNKRDTLATSIHNGRTDGRWNRIIGPVFRTYIYRNEQKSGETVADMFKRCSQQIVNTMRCNENNLHGDEMFFQYQGDLLTLNEIAGEEAERLPLKLNSLPFHFQVFGRPDEFIFQVRYWANRFDGNMVDAFVTAYEDVIAAMLHEKKADRLKDSLSDNLFIKDATIEVRELNELLGRSILTDVADDTRIKVAILDEEENEKPMGAWGELYIEGYEPADCTGKVFDEFDEIMQYGTGIEARILPDGSLDLLYMSGKLVLQETLGKYNFIHLGKVEQALVEYDGIERARASMYYNSNNRIELAFEIQTSREIDEEGLGEWLKTRMGEEYVPSRISYVE